MREQNLELLSRRDEERSRSMSCGFFQVGVVHGIGVPYNENLPNLGSIGIPKIS